MLASELENTADHTQAAATMNKKVPFCLNKGCSFSPSSLGDRYKASTVPMNVLHSGMTPSSELYHGTVSGHGPQGGGDESTLYSKAPGHTQHLQEAAKHSVYQSVWEPPA